MKHLTCPGVRVQEVAARWFFQQLILGIDYCHKKGVANRDVKLENTLLQVGAKGNQNQNVERIM